MSITGGPDEISNGPSGWFGCFMTEVGASLANILEHYKQLKNIELLKEDEGKTNI